MARSFGILLLIIGAGACASVPAETPPPSAPVVQAVMPAADSARPLPPPVDLPPDFTDAIQRGTRTTRGEPGARYWTQWADYRLSARIEPETKLLVGNAAIAYRNNSPDTLRNLHLELTQNFHAPGVVRMEAAEVTGGVRLKRVVVNGTELRTGNQGPRYQVFGTRLVILPPQPVAPGTTTNLEIEYEFTIPQRGAGERMGWNDDNLFYIGYWYPQMTVYDDVVGWFPDPFVGTTEFYAGFGNYDVRVDAPAGWLVAGTGELVNAQEVLAPAIYERYQRARNSDQVVNILTAADFANGATRSTNGRVIWHFTADSVRDVAFSITRESVWDGARTAVGDRNGDGQTDYTVVQAIYRPTARLWTQSVRYSQHIMRFLSTYLGEPYPWPHMTAVEGGGIIGGGMEYPMMTLIGDYTQAGDTAHYAVTAHEEAHMWFPMMVSSDERRRSWMDEGTTTFNENQAKRDFFGGRNFDIDDQRAYLQIAGSGMEGEMMRWSQYHYSTFAYGIASYAKPATMLVALRAVLGEDMFNRGLRTYLDRWKYKHPTPWDMWNTFENVSGRDLDWFWSSWYQTTWELDQAVRTVTQSGDSVTITVVDLGRVPMPVRLAITTQDGRTVRHDIPVDVWLRGQRQATATVDAGGVVTRVVIDPENVFPDVNPQNNVWQR